MILLEAGWLRCFKLHSQRQNTKEMFSTLAKIYRGEQQPILLVISYWILLPILLIRKVWEEPSELVSDETSLIVSVSHHLETTKEDERKKTDGQEEVKTKGEIYKEMKIKVIKIEKVVEVESIVEEYLQQKEQKEESCAKVEMVKGEEGELKMMYQFKEEAKVDHVSIF